MVHWPPSPRVEDEVTALSHEHNGGKMIKSEDEPVISRGSVDQYPIIVDSDDQREVGKNIPNGTTKDAAEDLDRDTSDDSSGPKTPSPTNERKQRRPSPPSRNKSVSFDTEITAKDGQKSSRNASRSRGRPEVSRIQTSLGEDLRAMASGQRRDPSPYSYSRESIKEQLSPLGAEPGVSAINSAVNVTRARASAAHPTDAVHEQEEATRHTGNKAAAPGNLPDIPAQHRETPVVERGQDAYSVRRTTAHRRSPHEEQSKPQSISGRRDLQQDTMTPPRSRRVSRESSYGSANGDMMGTNRTIRSTRQSGVVRESPQASPYTSSAEEGRAKSRNRQQARQDHHKEYIPRPLTDRRERPRMDDLGDRISSPRNGRVAIADDLIYTRSPKPKTPLTADVARKANEDYFEQALKENLKRSRQGLNVRTSVSAQTSPMTSPPRTPKSERQSRDYLDLAPPVARPVQRSRPPSIDEGHVKDPRVHASLLSAATAGAAIAARTSGESSKSGATSGDYSSSNSISKPTSTPRSRRPSPVSEESRPYVGSVSSTQLGNIDSRPNPRGSLQMPDRSGFSAPQRALSASGPVPAPVKRTSQANSPVEARQGPPTNYVLPISPNTYSTGQSWPAVAPMLDPNFLSLPSCPRPQPTSAYNDWWSIKELSHLDVCPTCVGVIANTKYRDLFVKSLPRPYNEPSVCAMSKPWLRIAFMQALRRGQPNLNYLRAVSMLPPNVSPCKGQTSEQRKWFRIEDPSTRTFLPNFVACTACVRAVDNIFPEVTDLFARSKDSPLADGICSLNVQSKNFPQFIDLLEQTSSSCQGGRLRTREAQCLIDYIRKATRNQQCPRDRLTSIRLWHFIPDLPEFTVCESCYKEVVWPIHDKSVAREMSKIVETVPARQGKANPHTLSCQLYSNRMRKIFHEAVSAKSFSHLRDAARARHDVQQRLLNQNKLYEQDQLLGIDRRAEIARNAAIWRSWE